MPVVNFKVLHSLVGPFPKDHVFTREEFARLHPAPKGHKNAAKYHDGLIERLLQIKAITTTDDAAEVETPVGPENMEPKPADEPELASAKK